MQYAECKKRCAEIEKISEISRAYEQQVTELALAVDNDLIKNALLPLVAEGNYVAYCVLHTHYRRYQDHSELISLEKNWGAKFKFHPSSRHYELLTYVDFGEEIEDEAVLKTAKDSAAAMNNAPGALNLFADLVATYFETHLELADSPSGKKWIADAADAVTQAILCEEYPKFYYTKARLLCLQENYREAVQLLTRAVDKEDSSRSDYALRISRYLYAKTRIEALEQLHKTVAVQSAKQAEAEQKIEKQLNTLSESSTKNLEYLGLFAGIISFTIGGISIAANASAFSFKGAAGLLIVLMGALLTVFCGFGIVLHGVNRKHIGSTIIVLLLGILTIILGVFLCL